METLDGILGCTNKEENSDSLREKSLNEKSTNFTHAFSSFEKADLLGITRSDINKCANLTQSIGFA
jgi:hypothetical protein